MKILKSLVVVALACSSASARPYFRLIDPRHPQPVAGALLAPEDVRLTEGAALLPLVTHSQSDGCLMPSIVCEDWTPLSVGGSMVAGDLTFDVAPLANVLPWMQAAAKAVLPEKLQLGELGQPNEKSVTFSAGPVFEYKSRTNKGYFRVFTGLALHF